MTAEPVPPAASQPHGVLLVQASASHLPLRDESVDSIVCDPPYDLTAGKRGGTGEASVNLESPYGRARIGTGNGGGGFMGKEWDSTGVAFDPATWREALRVLKPGGHLIAFGGTRTYHRMVCAIEDAGFEIRDSLMWLYGTGFPKSLNVATTIDKAAKGHPQGSTRGDPDSPNSGKFKTQRTEGKRSESDQGQQFGAGPGQFMAEPGEKYERDLVPEAAAWEGWGTALKPAYEPIVLARKPLIGTVAANVLRHGTGAINIDGTRIGTSKDVPASPRRAEQHAAYGDLGNDPGTGTGWDTNIGRWPANVLLDEEAAAMLDAQTGERGGAGRASGPSLEDPYPAGGSFGARGGTSLPAPFYGDTGGASRFFYTAKASRAEREAGLDDMEATRRADAESRDDDAPGSNNPRLRVNKRRNDHPTVKPVALMAWLCRLVTPPGGIILDCFSGSGSTGLAALDEGFRYIGIDLDRHYLTIAAGRIAHRHLLTGEPSDVRADIPQGRLL